MSIHQIVFVNIVNMMLLLLYKMENTFTNVNINYLRQTFENISKQHKANFKLTKFRNVKKGVAAIKKKINTTIE